MTSLNVCSISEQVAYRLLSSVDDTFAESDDAEALLAHIQQYLEFPDEQKASALAALKEYADIRFDVGRVSYYIVCGVNV